MNAATDPKVAAILAQLTPRLREVLDLVGQGLPNKLIARPLGISEMTVKLHVKSLFRAFGVRNRTQLALLVRGAPPALGEGEDLPSRLAASEARFARLLIAFHDATRRPLGVTPDSGAEFYDHRLAEEAEARRPGIAATAEVDRAALSELEEVMGVKGAAAVLRTSLTLARIARAARPSSPTTGGAA